MSLPPRGWTQVIALLPTEIEALKAGNRVTRTYPEPLPHGMPPFLREELEAMRAGKHVMRMIAPGPENVVRVGNVLSVASSDRPRAGPPPLGPEDLEAMKAGKTVIRPAPAGPRPAYSPPDLTVKVVDYEQRGPDHIYTFEAVEGRGGGRP